MIANIFDELDRLDRYKAKDLVRDAAPDLLEALIALLPLVRDLEDKGPPGEGWQSDELLNIVKAADTAIAKAAGEVT